MANGIDFSDVQAYKSYVETFAGDLFTQIFYGFKTGELATPHEGVKGKHVLTELTISENLARRWDADFRGFQNTGYEPTVLEVVRNTVEHRVVPQQFESSYLGMMRRKGQSSQDYPFQAYVLQQVLNKLKAELEVAAWQGVAAGSPAITDFLRATFNGYLKKVADLVTATTITPVATGALTLANILGKFRDMWDTVDPAYKDNGTDIFISYPVYDMYRRAYKDAYKVDPAYVKLEGSDYMGIPYELSGGNAIIRPTVGMGTSQRVIMTPKENLHYGFDALQDWNNFQFFPNHRNLDFWLDFNFGVAITQARQGILVVNDQV